MQTTLVGIYNVLFCANLFAKMLSDLLLININSTALGRVTPIDVFRGSLGNVDDIGDKMESNQVAFA